MSTIRAFNDAWVSAETHQNAHHVSATVRRPRTHSICFQNSTESTRQVILRSDVGNSLVAAEVAFGQHA